MSERDDSHGGRYERERLTFGGVGLVSAGRCDECQRDSLAGRRKAKVKKAATPAALTYRWRVVSILSGNGAVGSVVLAERVA